MSAEIKVEFILPRHAIFDWWKDMTWICPPRVGEIIIDLHEFIYKVDKVEWWTPVSVKVYLEGPYAQGTPIE